MHTAPSEPWGSDFALGGLEANRSPHYNGDLSDGWQLFFLRRRGGSRASSTLATAGRNEFIATFAVTMSRTGLSAFSPCSHRLQREREPKSLFVFTSGNEVRLRFSYGNRSWRIDVKRRNNCILQR